MKQIKIIHSFWSEPTLEVHEKLANDTGLKRRSGGWLNKKYNYLSWALSCLTIRKIYDQVELVTDARGKSLLIDKLELPYTHVSVELDKLDGQNIELWATAKLLAYKIQKEPFLHLDSDVYLWKPFSDEIITAGLVAQNPENDFESYKNIWRQVLNGFEHIPSYITDDFKKEGIIRACNAGVFGGSDINFLHDFAEKALAFLKSNEDNFNRVNLGYSVLIYEQYLFAAYSRSKQKAISYLFNEVSSDYRELIDFKNVPKISNFIHTVGGVKAKQSICDSVERRLLLEYPDYYYRINKLLCDQII